MKHELNLVISPEEAANETRIKEIAAKQIHASLSDIFFVKTLKRSIDARSRNIKINLKIEIYVNEQPSPSASYKINYPEVTRSTPVIVIGAGPAG
ncbi:MAG: FAD-binding protein, partial [Bacteroidia bacterium]